MGRLLDDWYVFGSVVDGFGMCMGRLKCNLVYVWVVQNDHRHIYFFRSTISADIIAIYANFNFKFFAGGAFSLINNILVIWDIGICLGRDNLFV